MAALSALESQLREMTLCKICLEERDRQKQLPCQHTICLDCLSKLKLDNSKYKCPLCNQEYIVPNGGFESLPDSLITKQLATLLHSREWAAEASQGGGDAKNSSDDAMDEEPASVPETEAGRKLKYGVKRGRDSLRIAKQKIEVISRQQVDLQNKMEEIEELVNKMKEEKIAEIEKRAQRKIEGIRESTRMKIDESKAREDKLKESLVNTTEHVDKLETLVSELNSTKSERDITPELQEIQKYVADMDELFTPPEAGGTFIEGDSVRLRLDKDELTSEFFDSDLTHAAVGYILQRNQKEECAVVFPGNSAWTGKLAQLEKSSIQHTLPMRGDRVRVKSSVKEPKLGWGSVTHESIGVLSELKNHGTSNRRQVEVNFPEDDDWDGFYDELEVVPPEPLKVGDEVWVKMEVNKPAGGWAGVTHNSKGTLLSVNGDDVVVNFSECDEWRGLLVELERVRPISVGDKVRVLKSVDEPKTGWAGISHEDEGIVKIIQDNDEHGKVAAIDFPNRLGLWKCILSELELVERQSDRKRQGSGTTTIQRELRLPANLAHMHQQVMEQQAQQCAQQ